LFVVFIARSLYYPSTVYLQQLQQKEATERTIWQTLGSFSELAYKRKAKESTKKSSGKEARISHWDKRKRQEKVIVVVWSDHEGSHRWHKIAGRRQ
jgi:hypothetical protein